MRKEKMIMRVARILVGDFYTLNINATDKFPAPWILQQILREIDEVIHSIDQYLQDKLAIEQTLQHHLSCQQKQLKELIEKLSAALQNNKKGSAEELLTQKVDCEAQLPVLEDALFEYRGCEKKLKNCIIALQAKKREIEKSPPKQWRRPAIKMSSYCFASDDIAQYTGLEFSVEQAAADMQQLSRSESNYTAALWRDKPS